MCSSINVALVTLLSLLFFTPAISAGELHEAVRTGDVGRVKQLLEQNPALVDSKDEHGMTPLFYAVSENNVELVKLLLGSGADAKGPGIADGKIIHSAASAGAVEAAKLLLDKGADVNARSEVSDDLPLIDAVSAEKRRREMCILLLDHGAQINAQGAGQKTALHYAVTYADNSDVIDLLLTRNADTSIKDHLGATAFLAAALKHATDYVAIFLKHGVKWDIFSAAAIGNLNEVKHLLSKDAQLLKTKNDYSGETPLHYAVTGGKEDVVKFLLDKGADVNARNAVGMTPLSYARQFDQPRILVILQEHGGKD